MEKITSVQFDSSEVISATQTRSIFGGKMKTCAIVLNGQRVKDRWDDRNDNGRMDKGDVIYTLQAPYDGGDDDPETTYTTQEEVEASGAELVQE